MIKRQILDSEKIRSHKPDPSPSGVERQTKVSNLAYLQEWAGNRAVHHLIVQRQMSHPEAPMSFVPSGVDATQASGASADSNPKRDLARKIVADIQRGGITVAVYVSPNQVEGGPEFERQAIQFAVDHRALGLIGGEVREGIAMELSTELPNLLASLNSGIERLLAQYPDLTRESISVPVQTLAIFTHGTRTNLQAGSQAQWIRPRLGRWVENLTPFLNAAPRMLLYACSTAGEPVRGVPYAEAIRLALQSELEEHYGPEANVAPEVWGHTTAGHATANRNLVEFEGGATSANTSLLTELGQRLAARFINLSGQSENITPDKRASIEEEGIKIMSRVLRAKSGTRSPTNVYIREIPQMGIDRVWQHLLMPGGAPDVSDLDLTPEAKARLLEGLAVFQERFATETTKLDRFLPPIQVPTRY